MVAESNTGVALQSVEACKSALARAQGGDKLAFAELARAHQSSVFSLALRMLKQRDLAEDLAQDVFLQLYRKLADIESASHLAFWLRRVAANLAIDRLRGMPRLVSVDDDATFEAEAPAGNGDHLLERQLGQLLRSLNPPARAVMLLRFQEDLDPTEIARALDMPVNTVKSHLKRSLDSLRGGITANRSIVPEDLGHG